MGHVAHVVEQQKFTDRQTDHLGKWRRRMWLIPFHLTAVANEMLVEFVRFRTERGNDVSGSINVMEVGERL
jgi:hypothetical protein